MKFVIGLVAVAVVGTMLWDNLPWINNSRNVVEEPVACTMDAMMCPDGTWVGRTGPNCEFVCPTQ
jgi:hypothetical protein